MAQRIRTHAEHQEALREEQCKRGIHRYSQQFPGAELSCEWCFQFVPLKEDGSIKLEERSSYTWAKPKEESDERREDVQD